MAATTARSGLPAPLAVAAGAAIIGLAPIGLRLSEVGPQATAFWRFAFAMPLLAILWRAGGERFPTERAAILLFAGVCFGMDIALWHAALTMTTVANATLISNMTPILAGAAGLFLFKERLSGAFLQGAGVALSGVALLSLARVGQAETAAAQTLGLQGDLTALGSAVWYAAYLVLLSRQRLFVGARTTMLITTFASMILALCAALIAGESLLPRTAQGWALLAGLGLFVHVGGQGLIAVGVGQLPITVSTVLLWVQPVTAAAFAWTFFGEALSAVALLGAALVLGGVWLVQRGRARAAT